MMKSRSMISRLVCLTACLFVLFIARVSAQPPQVRDTEAPVVKLIGPDTVRLAVYGHYTEQGVEYHDNYYATSDLKLDILGKVDTANVDSFKITYKVTDKSRNIGLATRTVIVEDRIAPTVLLKGEPAITLCQEGSGNYDFGFYPYFTDPGVLTTDNYYLSSAIQVEVLGTFTDTKVPGLYHLQYKVTDPSGNSTTSDKRYILVLPKTDKSCIMTSVTENVKSEMPRLIIFPNPITGLAVRVQWTGFSDHCLVQLINTVGQCVKQTAMPAGENSLNWDLHGLSPGYYLLQLRTESGVLHTQTLVLQP